MRLKPIFYMPVRPYFVDGGGKRHLTPLGSGPEKKYPDTLKIRYRFLESIIIHIFLNVTKAYNLLNSC
jgi:hypothetical protein